MPDPNVTSETPLRCDRCSKESTVGEVEARPLVSCPSDCYMGPRWQTLDGVPYYPEVDQAYPPRRPDGLPAWRRTLRRLVRRKA